jgi:hypothetical protein
MKEEQNQFMRLLGQLPARLTAEQAAWVINCQPHDVPVLVAARLLKPLGNPPANSVKFFAALEVLEQAKDAGAVFDLAPKSRLGVERVSSIGG